MNFKKYDELFNIDNYPLFQMNSGIYLPADEGQCICLSGKKYKECCKKEVEIALDSENNSSDFTELQEIYYQKESKLISYKVVDKAINKKNISYCSAEKAFGNCDKTNNVKSHTMSRGNVLSNLAGIGNKSVMAFNDHIIADPNIVKSNIDLYYKDILIDDASLTVAFCKKHDTELFIDIETDGKKEYVKSSIQNLEYALKAVSFDIYYKIENIRYLALLVQKTKKVLCSYNGERSKFLPNYYNAITELFTLYPMMNRILCEIKELKEKGVAPKLSTVCFDLPIHKVNISCSEVITEGEQYYFINVINSSEPYLLFSYYDDVGDASWIINEKKKFDLCRDKILYLYDLFLAFLVCNAQNIYINKDAFKRLSNEEKIYLYIIHREGTAHIPRSCHDSNIHAMFKLLFDK